MLATPVQSKKAEAHWTDVLDRETFRKTQEEIRGTEDRREG